MKNIRLLSEITKLYYITKYVQMLTPSFYTFDNANLLQIIIVETCAKNKNLMSEYVALCLLQKITIVVVDISRIFLVHVNCSYKET